MAWEMVLAGLPVGFRLSDRRARLRVSELLLNRWEFRLCSNAFRFVRLFKVSMGHVRERVRLYSSGRSLEVVALIDTGATTLVLPESVARELGVEAMGGMDVELADGSVRRVSYGVVEVELQGRRAPTVAAIIEGGEVCVGVEVLERLGLAVDPATGRVYPTRRFVTRL